MKDVVPPHRNWQQLGEVTARFHHAVKLGYEPFSPSHEYFRMADGCCYLRGYASFMRWYRKTMRELGVELRPIPSLKQLGVRAA